MKKYIVIFVISLITIPSALFSQNSYPMDQGSILLGGNAGYVNQDTKSTIYFTPNILYFIQPNIGLGGTVNFLSIDSRTQYGIGPKIAYYFGNQDKTAIPFVSGSFFYNKLSNSEDNTYFRFSGGVTSMLNSNIGITGEAFYLTDEDTFGILFGIDAFIF